MAAHSTCRKFAESQDTLGCQKERSISQSVGKYAGTCCLSAPSTYPWSSARPAPTASVDSALGTDSWPWRNCCMAERGRYLRPDQLSSSIGCACDFRHCRRLDPAPVASPGRKRSGPWSGRPRPPPHGPRRGPGAWWTAPLGARWPLAALPADAPQQSRRARRLHSPQHVVGNVPLAHFAVGLRGRVQHCPAPVQETGLLVAPH